MHTSPIRVLVVDDNEPWHRFFSTTLGKQPDLQVIGRASDGLEAVHQAQQLQPDIILLDIGLPTQNGIEAARQIRKLSPVSKILFVSENRAADIAKEALRTGASGYVVKSHAGNELLPALKAVLEGKQFVSASLALFREPAHVVQFYAHDADLLDGLGALFSKELRAGGSVAAVMTSSHRKVLMEQLVIRGIDVDEVAENGRLAVLDAVEALNAFMDDDLPNGELFLLRFGKLIRATQATALMKNAPLLVFGEMVSVLWEQKNCNAAIRLEQLWNELARTHSFYLCCAYSASQFQGALHGEPYTAICAEHTHVVSAFASC